MSSIKKKNPIFVGLFFLFLSFSSTNAYALKCVNLNSEVGRLAAQFSEPGLKAAFSAAEQMMSGLFTAETIKQKSAITTAQFHNTKSTRSALIALESIRLNRDTEAAPLACATTENYNSSLTAAVSSGSFSRASLNLADSTLLENSQSSSENLLRNLASLKTNYPQKGSFSLLWDGGVSTGVFGTRAKTYSSQQQYDANKYIETLSSAVRFSGSDGKGGDLYSLSDKAIASVSLSAFTDELSRRSPIQALDRHVQKSGSLKTGTLNSNASDQMSYDGFLSNEVDRRFMDSSWAAEVGSKTSQVPLVKERLYMRAVKLKLMQETLAQARKIEMQMATNNLIQLRK